MGDSWGMINDEEFYSEGWRAKGDDLKWTMNYYRKSEHITTYYRILIVA